MTEDRRCRLTPEQVREIRSRYWESLNSSAYFDRADNQTTLAAEYGVSIHTIHNVLTFKTYKGVA